MMRTTTALACALSVLLPCPVAGQNVSRVETLPTTLRLLPFSSHGRVQPEGRTSFVRQWPGTYFETAFRGSSAMFRLGAGHVSLRLRVDGGVPIPLVNPEAGLYRISGLQPIAHRLRIDVVSEDQERPSVFGGFYTAAGTTPRVVPRRSRQIEFIGDSYTVGYGNTSPKRQCTRDEVWATTDTSQGIAPRVAARYSADYEVNAISGRGMVRNYNGLPAPTLPAVYPYVLFDKARPYANPHWRPQVIVIGLGTNDFSTPLNAAEKWKTRADLQSDFERTYVRFVKSLRARNPRAFVLLWVADNETGELTSEVTKVAELLRGSGEQRVGFVQVRGIAGTGCDFHPSLDDDQKIARALASFIDSQPQVWRTR